MRLRLNILVLLLVTGTTMPALAANTDDFRVWSTTGLPGRLFVPTDYNPSTTYPLILFFHGAGEGGTDNVKQVNGNIDHLLAAAKQRNAFLYAPQSPTGFWASTGTTPTAHLEQAVSMIGTTAGEYNLDLSRTYVTGLSAGGGGTWDALGRYPDTFAAGVPICGTSGANLYRPTLVDKPIWAFHARDDTVVSVANSQNMFNAISTADGSPATAFPPLPPGTATTYFDEPLRYTEFADGGHGIWHRVYEPEIMYDWLFAQSIPEPTAAVVAVIAASLSVLRRRKKEDPALSRPCVEAGHRAIRRFVLARA